MVKTLENHCANSKNLTIKALGRSSRHYYGGGDIQVFTESYQLLSAAVVTSEGRDEEEDGPENRTPTPPPSDDSQNTTPPKRHAVKTQVYFLPYCYCASPSSFRNAHFDGTQWFMTESRPALRGPSKSMSVIPRKGATVSCPTFGNKVFT